MARVAFQGRGKMWRRSTLYIAALALVANHVFGNEVGLWVIFVGLAVQFIATRRGVPIDTPIERRPDRSPGIWPDGDGLLQLQS
jgi:hypothetical protein